MTPVHEEVLVQIKGLASKTPILKPISYTSGKPIYLFTDISKVAV
jgi:hypothetical protein